MPGSRDDDMIRADSLTTSVVHAKSTNRLVSASMVDRQYMPGSRDGDMIRTDFLTTSVVHSKSTNRLVSASTVYMPGSRDDDIIGILIVNNINASSID